MSRCIENAITRIGSMLKTEGSSLNKFIVIWVIASSLILTGCQEIRNEQVGTGVGAALGGLLGAQVGGGSGKIAAAVVGALAGAYIGGNVGRTMDEVDRRKANQTLENTPTGQTTSWSNPDNGNTYAVTPTQTYNSGNQPCREYSTEAWIDGRKETVTGTACRDANGNWRSS